MAMCGGIAVERNMRETWLIMLPCVKIRGEACYGSALFSSLRVIEEVDFYNSVPVMARNATTHDAHK